MGSRSRGSSTFSRSLCDPSRFETTQRSAPERRIKARARDQFYACNFLAFARVRAFVVGFELRFKCPTPASPCTSRFIHFSISRIPGAQPSILAGFRVVNTTERNDFGAFSPVPERPSTGFKQSSLCCNNPASAIPNITDTTQSRRSARCSLALRHVTVSGKLQLSQMLMGPSQVDDNSKFVGDRECRQLVERGIGLPASIISRSATQAVGPRRCYPPRCLRMLKSGRLRAQVGIAEERAALSA